MAIFIVAVVLLTFMEALSVGITGTMQLNRKTSALNLAKSQIEYVKTLDYNASAGDLEIVYWPLISTGGNITDIVNYNISGQVSNVSVNRSLQEITVNVSYLTGKSVEMTGYKISDGTDIETEARGLMVTDNIRNVPTLPQGYSFLCAGQYKGFYHVFTTGTAGPISVSWTFDWDRVSGTSSMGAPMVAIYEGVPNWTIRDSQDEVREDGMITRNQNVGVTWASSFIGIGDLPGRGTGEGSMCDCCHSSSGNPANNDYCDGEDNPIAWAPHHCPPNYVWIFPDIYYAACLLGGYGWNGEQWPCCGACVEDSAGSPFWDYDSDTGVTTGTIDFVLTIEEDVDVGTYTVLLFNAENAINLDTQSAAVTYWK